MPPAARVGDMTSHGTPLGPGIGSLNVLIGGQPAWRVQIDIHACPLVNGTVPHLAGIVMAGSVTVRINQMFAARMGDTIVEGGGGPNTITIGCPTVQIGG